MAATTSPNCVFCSIIGGEETVSIIHEDEEIIAFLDIQPLHPGHVLVVPKTHYKDLFFVPEELAARAFAMARRILPGLRKATGCRAVNLFYVPEELAARTFAVAQRILPGLRKATGCRAVNLFSANGADGGQDVFHFHLHLIPVPEGTPFPLQLPDASAQVPSRSELDVMAARIGKCIHDELAPATQPA